MQPECANTEASDVIRIMASRKGHSRYELFELAITLVEQMPKRLRVQRCNGANGRCKER